MDGSDNHGAETDKGTVVWLNHVMVAVVLLALSETSSIAMAGLFDVIAKADAAYGALRGRPGRDTIFDLDLVGLDGLSVRMGHRVAVTPDVAAADVETVDLVVVPGLGDGLVPSFEANTPWAPWIAKWRGVGAVIASSCSGAFLLAEAGMLDGRPATTHWITRTPCNVAIPTSTFVRSG